MSSSKKPTNFEILFEEIKNSEYEVREIGEVATGFFVGENAITKSNREKGNRAAIICSDIFTSNVQIDKFSIFVDENSIDKKIFVEKGDIVIARSGYTEINNEGFCLFLENFSVLLGNDTYVLKHNQNPKYLINALKSESCKEQTKRFFKPGLLKRIYSSEVKKIKIPLPSLDLQTKIGDFLFSFVEYDKQLKREQKSRSKQFHFFKEQIFSELVEKCRLRNVGWEIKSIGDFATEIYSGKEITRDQLGTGNYPAIKAGDLNSGLKIKFFECISFVDEELINKKIYFEKDDLLISKLSNKAETIGISTYLGDKKGLLGEGVASLKHNQNPSYISYACSSSFVKEQIKERAQRGTVINFYVSEIKQIQIPLPPLEEQKRIVEILDKFYDLSENPDKGLNKLIKLNRKQYEYYRNLIFDQLKI